MVSNKGLMGTHDKETREYFKGKAMKSTALKNKIIIRCNFPFMKFKIGCEIRKVFG